jgi:hypothetical protein
VIRTRKPIDLAEAGFDQLAGEFPLSGNRHQPLSVWPSFGHVLNRVIELVDLRVEGIKRGQIGLDSSGIVGRDLLLVEGCPDLLAKEVSVKRMSSPGRTA